MTSRFTPTCVGKTDKIKSRSAPSVGSPPHAWGRHKLKAHRQDSYRFTPTCVGKTICGPVSGGLAVGSPPHAWGRQYMGAGSKAYLRFTPTCVGKTIRVCPRLLPSSVHPHMRGEDMRSGSPVSLVIGSPPHAWGRRCQGFDPGCFFGSPPHAWGRRLIPSSWAVLIGSPPHAWGRP